MKKYESVVKEMGIPFNDRMPSSYCHLPISEMGMRQMLGDATNFS